MYGENMRMKSNTLIRTVRKVLQKYCCIVAVWRERCVSKGK
jgi:phage gp36-like protein